MQLPEIDSIWNYDDPAASEIAFLTVLPRARETNNHDYVAQLLTQIARSQILQRRYDAGEATLNEVAQLLSEHTPVARIRYLLERGRYWNDTDRANEAKSSFQVALSLAIEKGFDALAVDAAHMLGVMGPFDEAVRWNRRASELAEASSDPRARRWIGTLSMNLGCNYQRLAEYQEAELAFERAVAAFEQMGNATRVRLARTCLAKNHRLNGAVAIALAELQPLLAEIQAAGENDGYAQEEIAECLLTLGREEQSRPFFANAYKSLSTYPWFPPNEVERLQRLKTFGGLASGSESVENRPAQT